MPWHGELQLEYQRTPDGQTRASHQHRGPLRVLKALYPEGPSVCHHVIIHPPAGLVSGDHLTLTAHVGPGAHALLSTPGATRWYRASQTAAEAEARQSVTLVVATGGRLEWLPLETLVYDGARACSRLKVALAPGAAMIGWDLVSLGLPAAGAPFKRGVWDQSIHIDGLWREAGRIHAQDDLLMDSPLGLAGRRALLTVWLAWGDRPDEPVVTQVLEAARHTLTLWDRPEAPHQRVAGVSRLQPRLVVLRALAQRTEPLFELARAVRGAWREAAWGLPANAARIWSV